MAKDGLRPLRLLVVLSLIVAPSSAAIASPGLSPQAFGGRSTEAAAGSGPGMARTLEGLRAIEALEPEALRRWPQSFAGLWLEGDKVFVAFTEHAERRVERLGRDFPKPGRLRAVSVDDSLAALRELQAQMIADRESNPPARRFGYDRARSTRPPPDERPPETPPEERPPEPRPEPLDYDLEIDIKRNVVVAIVEEAVTPELAAAFTERYGEDAVVEQGLLVEPLACTSRLECTPFLRSGLQTQGSTNCSTAFNSQIFGGDLVLSAAHCGDPDADVTADRYHAGMRYGSVVAEQQSGPVDAEVHIVNQPGFDAFSPWIYASGGLKKGKVKLVGSYDGLPVGLFVCKSGVTTGQSCGEVLSKTYSPDDYVPDGVDFIRASVCAEPGDSGAGVYHAYGRAPYHEALGVLSGSPTLECGDPEDFSTFGHVEFIQDAFTIKILKAP